MIPATDLRINNYVLDSRGIIKQVACIGKRIALKAIGDKGYNPAFAYDVEEISGVVLTPEVLEKVGFVLNKDRTPNCWVKYITGCKCFTIAKSNSDGDYQRVWWDCVYCFYVDFNSLHELQNLYYCLTKTELSL